jgi:hypothetical protein
MRLAGVSEDEFESEEDHERKKLEEKMFLQRKKKPMQNILFDESRDCPICMEMFKGSDEVIQLNCSKAHIYHAECIQEYLENTNSEKKCPLCREPNAEKV